LLCNFAARDAELNQLKMLVEQLADKVNARGDTPAERLTAVENRVDEVATHGIRLGTTLGLAAWCGTRWAMPRVRAVPAGFATRAPRGKERERPGFRKGGT
jgi:hypothetical protein